MRGHADSHILARVLVVGITAALGCDPASRATVDAAVPVGDADGDVAGQIACGVSPPTSCPSVVPRYDEIASIVMKRCQPCHLGTTVGGPWGLTEYRHIADWEGLVRTSLIDCSMPPADAGAMTLAERMTFLNWLRCDLPR